MKHHRTQLPKFSNILTLTGSRNWPTANVVVLPTCSSVQGNVPLPARKALRSVGPVQWSVAGFDRFLTYSTLGHCCDTDGFSHSHAAVRGRKMRALLWLTPLFPSLLLPFSQLLVVECFATFWAKICADWCAVRSELKQINTKTMQMAKGMSAMLASNWQREKETESDRERASGDNQSWSRSCLRWCWWLRFECLRVCVRVCVWLSSRLSCRQSAAKHLEQQWQHRPTSQAAQALAGDQWSLPTRAPSAVNCGEEGFDLSPLLDTAVYRLPIESRQARAAPDKIIEITLAQDAATSISCNSCDLSDSPNSDSNSDCDCDCERFLWAYATRSPTLWCNRAN